MTEDAMTEFFQEGGWGMWPVLVFGMVTLGAAGRFAFRPEVRQLGFLGAMTLTTFGAMFNATWTDIAAVFQGLSEKSPTLSEEQFRAMMTAGFMESTRPATLGGALLTLACLLVAVGALRANRSDP
jgi:hypothetical protein